MQYLQGFFCYLVLPASALLIGDITAYELVPFEISGHMSCYFASWLLRLLSETKILAKPLQNTYTLEALPASSGSCSFDTIAA